MSFHIFGDSHANFNFVNFNCINHYINSLTMNRIGRDKLDCINFMNYRIQNNDTVIYQVGEVDCRNNIGKQLQLDRNIDEIITTLVDNFIESIKLNVKNFEKINVIICCILPTMNSSDYYNKKGIIEESCYPWIGSDFERSNYTKTINQLLKNKCKIENFLFLDYYEYYEDNNGTLKLNYTSDGIHINNNIFILQELNKLIK